MRSSGGQRSGREDSPGRSSNWSNSITTGLGGSTSGGSVAKRGDAAAAVGGSSSAMLRSAPTMGSGSVLGPLVAGCGGDSSPLRRFFNPRTKSRFLSPLSLESRSVGAESESEWESDFCAAAIAEVRELGAFPMAGRAKAGFDVRILAGCHKTGGRTGSGLCGRSLNHQGGSGAGPTAAGSGRGSFAGSGAMT
jgi:hypothetical protein